NVLTPASAKRTKPWLILLFGRAVSIANGLFLQGL
ncbi:MAG: hypothetical protein ACI81F_002465, partial [Thalassolituus oleivorans]